MTNDQMVQKIEDLEATVSRLAKILFATSSDVKKVAKAANVDLSRPKRPKVSPDQVSLDF